VGFLKRETLVEQRARQGGWHLLRRTGDNYLLRFADDDVTRLVAVKHGDGSHFVRFSAKFPILFSLDRTPHGLFGRLLLRNGDLELSTWHMDIAEHCEAQIYLCSQWPVEVVTSAFFDAVCHELVGEIRSFHQELRDKFHGSGAAQPRPSGWASGGSRDIVWMGE
jgi:hypothetical protein